MLMGHQEGSQGQEGIGGALRNDKGFILCMFSKSVGVKDSNEAELLAILEALMIFSCSFRGI